MTDWPTDRGEDSGPVRDPGEATADAVDPGRSTGSDGEGATGPLAVPDFMRQAMEAAHVDVDAVIAAATDAHVIPSDEEAAFVQAARAANGMRCQGCQRPVKADDPNVLREAIGWSRSREQGGLNHLIDRRETGGLLCGACGLRLQHGLSPQQETLGV